MTIRAALLGGLSLLVLVSSGAAQGQLRQLGRGQQGIQPDRLSNPSRAYGGSGGVGGSTSAPQQIAQAQSLSMSEVYTKAHFYLQVSKTARAGGKLTKAVKYLDKITALPFPDDAKSRRFLGSVLCNRVVLLKSQGKWKAAETAADGGLALLSKGNQPATYHVMLLHSMRGEILGQLGKKAAAAKAMKRAEDLELLLDAK